MRQNCWLVVFVVIVFFTACKKEKPGAPSDGGNPPANPPEQSFYKDVKIDSIQQLSMVVSFQLTKTFKATGIVTSLDSLSLINRLADYMVRDVVYKDGRYYAKIEWPYNLPPTDNIFWFRIFLTDDKGSKIYSPVFSQKIATYQIKNKYIVNGKGAYNKHPKDFFINYEGGVIGTYDNSLIVNAVTNDVNIQNYRATLNDTPISVSRIDAADYPPGHKNILFDVPDNFPLGPATLKFYYLDKLVYTVDVSIVNGGLLSKDQHPSTYSEWSSIFVYTNELFTFRTGDQPSHNLFYKWSPENKQWTTLSSPNFVPKILNYEAAYPVDGVVYFCPIQIRPKILPYYYKEVLTTYSPSTNTWGEIELLNTTNQALDRGLEVLESFAIKDNLYFIIRESPKLTPTTSRCVLKVYNVKNKSWEEVMEIPQKYYTATVLNDKVYLFSIATEIHDNASTTFKNEFSLLDLTTKSFTPKAAISHPKAGVFNPYMTSYNGKIYLYGGQSSSGFVSIYSSVFAVYDPNTNKWAPVSGYSYFTGWVSQTSGFMTLIGDKIYLGLGRDRYTNGNINGGKPSRSIYQVAVN